MLATLCRRVVKIINQPTIFIKIFRFFHFYRLKIFLKKTYIKEATQTLAKLAKNIKKDTIRTKIQAKSINIPE